MEDWPIKSQYIKHIITGKARLHLAHSLLKPLTAMASPLKIPGPQNPTIIIPQFNFLLTCEK